MSQRSSVELAYLDPQADIHSQRKLARIETAALCTRADRFFARPEIQNWNFQPILIHDRDDIDPSLAQEAEDIDKKMRILSKRLVRLGGKIVGLEEIYTRLELLERIIVTSHDSHLARHDSSPLIQLPNYSSDRGIQMHTAYFMESVHAIVPVEMSSVHDGQPFAITNALLLEYTGGSSRKHNPNRRWTAGMTENEIMECVRGELHHADEQQKERQVRTDVKGLRHRWIRACEVIEDRFDKLRAETTEETRKRIIVLWEVRRKNLIRHGVRPVLMDGKNPIGRLFEIDRKRNEKSKLEVGLMLLAGIPVPEEFDPRKARTILLEVLERDFAGEQRIIIPSLFDQPGIDNPRQRPQIMDQISRTIKEQVMAASAMLADMIQDPVDFWPLPAKKESPVWPEPTGHSIQDMS